MLTLAGVLVFHTVIFSDSVWFSSHSWIRNLWAAEKRPSAAFPSSFVVGAYIRVRLTPQDCLPDRQVKNAAGAFHLGIFEQPGENDFFMLTASDNDENLLLSELTITKNGVVCQLERLWGNCFLEARFARMIEVPEKTFRTLSLWVTRLWIVFYLV